jgi:GGDEF domain-containing protein
LHDDIKQPEDALVIAQRILEKLSAPYDIGEEPAVLSFSLGVVANAREYQNAEEILSQAEKKMEAIRKAGGNRFELVD